MTCNACGGTQFDEHGICLSCGAANQPAHEANFGALVAATPAAAEAPVAVAPELTPPPRRFSVPASVADPAATNPSSGHFCGRCGSAVDAKNDFCGICGNPLKDEALQRVRESRLVSLRPSVVSTSLGHITANGTRPRRKPRSSMATRIFIICSLIAAVVIGVALGVLAVTHH
jgi:uncharacterized OB-fold protein